MCMFYSFINILTSMLMYKYVHIEREANILPISAARRTALAWRPTPRDKASGHQRQGSRGKRRRQEY